MGTRRKRDRQQDLWIASSDVVEFVGLDSERGIAWRTADSLSLRKFLGYALDEATPDHSRISRTRRLYWLENHKAIFRWILRILDEEGLISGRTISIDAATGP